MSKRSVLYPSFGCAVACAALILSSSILSGDTIEIQAFGTATSSVILTSTEVRFDRPVNLSTLRLTDGRGETVPHYFRPEPEPGYVGTLYWMWREVPMFHTETYQLHFEPGEWSTTPTGDTEIGRIAMQRKVMVPNGGFETVEDGLPTGWILNNAAPSTKYAYSGEYSIALNAAGKGGGSSYIAPSAGRVQGIKPGERYSLSLRLLVPPPEDGSTPQANPGRGIRVTSDITYYAADGTRTNRNLTHYYPMSEDNLARMGEWVLIRRAVPADEGAMEAEVRISTVGFDDTVYIDQVVMESISLDEPFKFNVSSGRPQ